MLQILFLKFVEQGLHKKIVQITHIQTQTIHHLLAHMTMHRDKDLFHLCNSDKQPPPPYTVAGQENTGQVPAIRPSTLSTERWITKPDILQGLPSPTSSKEPSRTRKREQSLFIALRSTSLLSASLISAFCNQCKLTFVFI